jgi:antitoxin component YwqK of YwqJK toxin-antitoxin module
MNPFARILLLLLMAACLSSCWRRDVGRSYYPSGKVRTEAAVKNNVLDGPAVMYYESGVKMSEAEYRAGVLSGKSVSYYDNGAKKAQAEFKDGVLNGTSISWSQTGAVQHSARFEEGRLVADEKTEGAEGSAAAKTR